MRRSFFLRLDNEPLAQARACSSRQTAVARYREIIEPAARLGRAPEGYVHVGYGRPAEQPEFHLHPGPRGAILCDRISPSQH